MQAFGFAFFTVAAMSLYLGLSACIYGWLPQRLLQCAQRHGRFLGLGPREVEHVVVPRDDHVERFVPGRPASNATPGALSGCLQANAA